MRIKKFVASNLKEAMDQMRRELGSSAIILNSRSVTKGGLLNFTGKSMVELTAAIDDEPIPAKNAHAANTEHSARRQPTAPNRREAADESPATVGAIKALQRMTEEFQQRADAIPTHPSSAEAQRIESLRTDLDELKGTMREIADHIKYSRMPSLPQSLKQSYLSLLENDVDEQLAADMVQTVYAKLGEDQLLDSAATQRQLVHLMASLLKATGPESSTKRRRVVALVGPTGVGKTTTVAKLAARAKFTNNKNVAIISTDTYRIGAIEQLRTFAAIADIPVEVVYKPAEMEAAMKKFRNADVVLIDTVGRSQRAKTELTELRRFLKAADPDETHLVLGAPTSGRTLDDIVRRFEPLAPNRFLFSKLDEAATFGSMLNVAVRHQKPISYFTIGQVVPDDLVPAQPTQLATMICSGMHAHA